MKKITFLLATVLFLATTKTNAQDANRECTIKANLFNGDYSSKKYDDALVNLNWLLDNCADKYVSMYQKGDVIAKKKYKEGVDKEVSLALIKRIYNQRLEYFPKKNPAKVHSDYATYLSKNKLGSFRFFFIQRDTSACCLRPSFSLSNNRHCFLPNSCCTIMSDASECSPKALFALGGEK